MYFKNTCILYLELFKFAAFCILVSKTDVFCIENNFLMHFVQLCNIMMIFLTKVILINKQYILQ